MECEHKTLRPTKEDPEIYFCLECGSRFRKKDLDLMAFGQVKPKPISEKKEEEKKPEIATLQVFLTQEEYDFLLKLLRRKLRGCSFVLAERSSSLKYEEKQRILKTFEICEKLINKIEIQK